MRDSPPPFVTSDMKMSTLLHCALRSILFASPPNIAHFMAIDSGYIVPFQECAEKGNVCCSVLVSLLTLFRSRQITLL